MSDDPEDNQIEFSDELRQFVYLDSLNVNSLLASLYMAIPEDVEQVFEEGEEGQKRKQAEAGLTLSNLLRFGGSGEWTNSDYETNQTRTSNRINDQYRFTVLYEALQERDKIVDLTGDEPDNAALNPGDVVKIEGSCSTDPLYRIFGTASILEDEEPTNPFDAFRQNSEDKQADEQREEIYNGMVGLKLQPKNEKGPFGMVVKEEELWIDSRRRFLGPQEYTVLARVQSKIKSQWDLIDVLRVLGGVIPSEKLDEMREKLLDGLFDGNNIDQQDTEQIVNTLLVQEIEENGMIGQNIDRRKNELRSEVNDHLSEKDKNQNIDLVEFMDREEFTLNEGYIVDPIAIYW